MWVLRSATQSMAEYGKSNVGEIWRKYANLLVKYPLGTKAATASVIASLGDYIAQRIEHSISAFEEEFEYCGRRSVSVAVDGMFVTGPGLHIFYGALERYFPTSVNPFAACLHIIFDTFLFDPFFVGTFFFTTGMLEGQSITKEIIPQVHREYVDAVKNALLISACFWPIQYSSFRFLPVQFRVLCVNFCDVIWTASLSFFSHKPIRPGDNISVVD